MKNHNEFSSDALSLGKNDEMCTPVSLIPNVLARLGLGDAYTDLSAYSIEQIVRALKEGAWATRVAAARELKRRAEHAPIAPLLAALDDAHGSVRAAAAEALGAC